MESCFANRTYIRVRNVFPHCSPTISTPPRTIRRSSDSTDFSTFFFKIHGKWFCKPNIHYCESLGGAWAVCIMCELITYERTSAIRYTWKVVLRTEHTFEFETSFRTVRRPSQPHPALFAEVRTLPIFQKISSKYMESGFANRTYITVSHSAARGLCVLCVN